MALSAPSVLEYNQLFSFYVTFSSRQRSQKPQALDDPKVKSWSKGILDVDFQTRKCFIRNGESVNLTQGFQQLQKVEAKEEKSDHILNLTFESNEWDIIPQNKAEAACLTHITQCIAYNHLITVAAVVKSGLQNKLIGLEQKPIFKEGLVQELDYGRGKLRERFLVAVPGKLFGFKKKEEIFGYTASFVTSLFNARVTTTSGLPGFQLHVDRMDTLYLDPLQEDERSSWISQLNASIEYANGAATGSPASIDPKLQRKANDVNAHARTDSNASLATDQEGTTGASKADTGSKETDPSTKPLSRARICLEDSLSELKILVGHIQASSHILNDLHLFTSSSHSRERKYISSATIRWPSTGKERSWPRNDWQYRHLYANTYEDVLMRSESARNHKWNETSPRLRHGGDITSPFHTIGPTDLRKQSNRKHIRNSDPQEGIDSESVNGADMDLSHSDGMDLSHSDGMYIDVENDGAATLQQISAVPDSGSIQERRSMKPNFSRQASARAPRAVAFIADPEISNDYGPSKAQANRRRASDDSFSSKNSHARPPTVSQPRSSQTNFALDHTHDQPDAAEDPPHQFQKGVTSKIRQPQLSARKSTQQHSAYAQYQQQSAYPDELVADNADGDLEVIINASESANHDDINTAQNGDDDDVDLRNLFVDEPTAEYDQEIFSDGPEQGATGRITYAADEEIPISQPPVVRKSFSTRQSQTAIPISDARKSVALKRQSQGFPIQPDTINQVAPKKNYVTRQSQTGISPPDTRKSIALRRQSQDFPVQPDSIQSPHADIRKSIAINRGNQPVSLQPEVRKSVNLNRKSDFGPDFNKPHSMQHSRLSLPTGQPVSGSKPYHVDVNRAVSQGHRIPDQNTLQQTSGDMSTGSLVLQQEDETSSDNILVPSALLTVDQEYNSSPTMSRGGMIEQRMSRVTATNSGPVDQIARSNQQARPSSLAGRPSPYDIYQSSLEHASGVARPSVRPNAALRSKSMSFASFDGNTRGGEEQISSRRQSH
ncbi:hypothetical protein KP509_33G058600 [Ceratopteris richardii]|uniref:PH domain-containing protein n=1 Tax=Ceratopteris richardii TaxID=49495 RepID=A0A8T2QR88_CERRI|nr:hypothetical protein KP509_33G058600 [Ceratopteris richardii]